MFDNKKRYQQFKKRGEGETNADITTIKNKAGDIANCFVIMIPKDNGF